MHPTAVRQVSVLLRSQIPQRLAEKIPHVPFDTHEARRAAPSLIEHLQARKDQRNAAFAAEKKSAKDEGRSMFEDVKEWPSNLRLEPIVKREKLGPLEKEVRRSLKLSLRER